MRKSTMFWLSLAVFSMLPAQLAAFEAVWDAGAIPNSAISAVFVCGTLAGYFAWRGRDAPGIAARRPPLVVLAVALLGAAALGMVFLESAHYGLVMPPFFLSAVVFGCGIGELAIPRWQPQSAIPALIFPAAVVIGPFLIAPLEDAVELFVLIVIITAVATLITVAVVARLHADQTSLDV